MTLHQMQTKVLAHNFVSLARSAQAVRLTAEFPPVYLKEVKKTFGSNPKGKKLQGLTEIRGVAERLSTDHSVSACPLCGSEDIHYAFQVAGRWPMNTRAPRVTLNYRDEGPGRGFN